MTKQSKIRNTAARSPLMRKGGVHQKSRGAERRADRLALRQQVNNAWSNTVAPDLRGDGHHSYVA